MHSYIFACELDSDGLPKGQQRASQNGEGERNCSHPLYDLRHTWAMRAAMFGTDLVTLAVVLGHSKTNMVMRYAHPRARSSGQRDGEARTVQLIGTDSSIWAAGGKCPMRAQGLKQRVPTKLPTVPFSTPEACGAARLRFGQDDVCLELRGVRCGLPTNRPELRVKG